MEKDALSILSKPRSRIRSVAQFPQNKISSIEKQVVQMERMITSKPVFLDVLHRRCEMVEDFVIVSHDSFVGHSLCVSWKKQI
jgi:hypothetical protein